MPRDTASFLAERSNNSLLVLGGSGRGKSQCAAIPACALAPAALVAVSAKAELVHQCHQRRARIGKLWYSPTEDPDFDPASFVRSHDTLFLLAPEPDGGQNENPLLAAVLLSHREIQARAHTSREEPSRPLTVVVDDADQLPPELVSDLLFETAAGGLDLVAVFQDLSRLRRHTDADSLLALFSETLVLPNMADAWTAGILSEQIADAGITPDRIMDVPEGEALRAAHGEWEPLEQARWHTPAWDGQR